MTQQTLDGEPARPRVRPRTLLWCPVCVEYILRRHQHEHPHDLDDERDVTDEKPALSDDCNISTQIYEVEFYYEYRETVRVEATSKSEAKWVAEEKATLQGEYTDTIHTSQRAVGDASIATVDYLETHGLLPEDHDVTPDDLARLAEGT